MTDCVYTNYSRWLLPFSLYVWEPSCHEPKTTFILDCLSDIGLPFFNGYIRKKERSLENFHNANFNCTFFASYFI
jgi:hypothetical protein